MQKTNSQFSILNSQSTPPIRLTPQEVKAIKQTFLEIFHEGEIYLFGSRTDSNLRGGDIDLYIHTQNKNNLLEKKVQFLARVKDKIGDQKIDLLLSKDTSRAIEQEAIEKGIKL